MDTRRPWGVRGLTDSPRAPLVAKAKIGEKGDRGQPKRLDYIIFVEPQTGRRLPEYQAVFGDRPTHFKALLSGDRCEDMIDVAWKRYGAKGLKCRGDGEIGIDRDTGEEIPCAGEFGAPEGQYRCRYANAHDGKPPECKPILSMRLVVPQIPGLGVVQLDTGGVASSIPTLMWQLRMIERATDGHMAGIAIEVAIRAFTDRYGNAAYGWHLTPLSESEAADLRTSFEGLVRIEGQVPTALPALEETPDADLYGLPAPEEEAEEVAVPGIPGDWASKVAAAENAFSAALAAARMPEAKAEQALSAMTRNRATAERGGGWNTYVTWLRRQAQTLGSMAEERASLL